jgi:hypothetical protein
MDMKLQIMDWTEWVLIPMAVLLLAAFHRLELLVIIVPASLLAGYALSEVLADGHSSRRKI